jgi:processive rubber oxygenase RoxA-like protein
MRAPVMQFRSAALAAVWMLAAAMLFGAGAARAQTAPAAAPPPTVTFTKQWSDADRETFYTTGQGSHLMPAVWFKALRRLDVDQPFAADQLARYGYLHNDSPSNLPVGFVIEARSGQLGMTCAACHTGQLEYTSKDGVNHVLRIDGGPASADFQQFLVDLTAAARAALSQSDRFDTFAKAVLGNGYSAASAAMLKSQFGDWVKQFGAFMDASLPTSPWGPARLDAFGMIYNRVAGLDLNIAGNIKSADAPVSYPFVWNASRQDHTQWNGGVPNGLFLQALARNSGEVFGVFGEFSPKALGPALVSYKNNSVDYAGLETLEEKIAVLQPPQWPSDLSVDPQLAQQGAGLFDQYCGGCHAEKTSPLLKSAWLTPVKAVGSDPKMYNNALRQSDPGIYSGMLLPPPALGVFANPASTKDMLASSVIGTILYDASTAVTPLSILRNGVWRAIRRDLGNLSDNQFNLLLNGGATTDIRSKIEARLSGMFTKPAGADAGAAYESRVLHGIWATAPYLHNGSVPNLWELMKPAKDRVATFNVGCRRFDPKNVGFVIDDPSCKTGTFIVDPNNANGNGNGGHEYGTDLTEDQRWAIVEFLKSY